MARFNRDGRYAPDMIECNGFDFSLAGNADNSDTITEIMYHEREGVAEYIKDCQEEESGNLSSAESFKMAELTLLKQLVESVHEMVEMLQDLRDVNILLNDTIKYKR